MTSHEHASSSDNDLPDVDLAVLVACHHRARVAAADLRELLPAVDDIDQAIERLLAGRLLESAAGNLSLTRHGRFRLDRILERIQGQLSPDDPAYERRYRRTAPSLPFEANTVWEEAICVNMRVAPDALRPLIPSSFELDLHDGWAFVSLTASRLRDFGVGRLPNALRRNFYQATYRAHVRFTDFRGDRMRGCYFVRSETNSRVMSLVANLMPEFRAHRSGVCRILMARRGGHLLLSVDSGEDPAGKVVLMLDASRPLDGMPASSVFQTVEAAREFLVDFYDAFAVDPRTGDVLILRIERGDWNIGVFEPLDLYLGYLSEGPFPRGAAVLDSVFHFQNTPYRWLPLLKERVAQRQ